MSSQPTRALQDRPVLGPAAVASTWALLIAICLAIGAAEAQAEPGAQQRREEAVIGTFRLKGSPQRPEGTDGLADKIKARDPLMTPDTDTPAFSTDDAPPVGGGPGDGAAAREDRALEILQAAVAALEDGRRDEARDLFEQVIAVAPASGEANRARRHLASLYRGDDGEVPRRERAVPGKTVARDVQPDDFKSVRPLEPEAAGRLAVPPPSERQPSVRTAPALTVEERWQRRRRMALFQQDFITMVGDRIFFGVGSQKLGARARQVLAQQAAWLRRHPDLAAVIEGHADDGSMAQGEQELISRARAEAVYNRLVEEGVEPTRLQVRAAGRQEPVAQCDEKACAAQNRRVVVKLTYVRDLKPEVAVGAEPLTNRRERPTTGPLTQ